MTEFEKSAIVGYWKSGATFREIKMLIGIPMYLIINSISNYIDNGNSHEAKKVIEPSEALKENSDNIQPVDQEQGQRPRVHIVWE